MVDNYRLLETRAADVSPGNALDRSAGEPGEISEQQAKLQMERKLMQTEVDRKLDADLDRIRQLTVEQLLDLHYAWEVHYGRLIRASEKGTAVRDALFEKAYAGVFAILFELRSRHGRQVDSFGFDLGSVNRICSSIGPPPATVLDIGCGTGTLVRELLTRGYSAYGIDLSADCIRIGVSLIEAEVRSQQPAALRYGDFMRTDFEEGQFDLIY